MTQEKKYDILLGIFVASLIAANLLGSKITTLFGISVSVGIFAYPITFLITDMVAEVMGKKKAQNIMVSGLVAQILVLILVAVSIALPANERFELATEYQAIFGVSIRIIVASLVAFGLSQLHDIWAFHKLKQKTAGKFLWLRNNLSTAVSQLFDTTLFMFIAFYQVTPRFDFTFIVTLIIPYWLFKVGFALVDTPIVYAGVKWLRGKSE
jgi:queuosine precursor transporter